MGDIVGSVYEWNNIKTKDFALFDPDGFFTDDTVLTVALADSVLSGVSYAENLRRYTRLYPGRGYGSGFLAWVESGSLEPYNSFGNGAAMRISPVGYAYDDLDSVLEQARSFTAVTHNHPEGIKGGQATAAAIYLARTGSNKEHIQAFLADRFGYDLDRTIEEIRQSYTFDESSQGTVPQAVRAFLESESFEDSIRTAISLGGDSDTLACINGSIAEAYYGGVPPPIRDTALSYLDEHLATMVRRFYNEVS